jgi:hypothetical protein
MTPPPRTGGPPPVDNIRNTSSQHWRGWLKPEKRCPVPFNSFAEYAREPNPEGDGFLARLLGPWLSWPQPAARRPPSSDARPCSRRSLDVLAAVVRKDYVDRRRRQAQGQAKAKAEGRYNGRPEDAERNDGIARMLAASQSWGINPERDRLQPP